MPMPLRALWLLLVLAPVVMAQEAHDHGEPEELGHVWFRVSCNPAVQPQFNRAVALLHSFAYGPAQQAFGKVAESDPRCAMAYWGRAMTYFHPVWSPVLPPGTLAQAQRDMQQAARLGAATARERGFIQALGALLQAKDGLTSEQRTLAYEKAMAQVARDNRTDVEAQAFYAVALLSNASPADKTHTRQKQAIAILEPLFREHPDHPGLAHYLIHACDSQELAQRGLPAARAYAKIAPSAPHALHMPSHIFTRLGLWNDSIDSNLASRRAAHAQGDAMGEWHAMDYLVYAYLQQGKDDDARRIVGEASAMPSLDMDNFAIAYAATVLPIRVAVEGGHWSEAANAKALAGAPPAVTAIAVWSKGLGLARSGHPAQAREQAARLRDIEKQLLDAGDDYWATQTHVLADEVVAWSDQASGNGAAALTLLQAAADREDSIEKRPVTPGPVIPAREQLGDLLLQQGEPAAAHEAFQMALAQAPGRRGAMLGDAQAMRAAR